MIAIGNRTNSCDYEHAAVAGIRYSLALSAREENLPSSLQIHADHEISRNSLDIVHCIAIELHHFRRLAFLFFVRAHRKCVLRDLDQHKVPLLPLFPYGLAHRVEIATVLHVEWLVHAAGDLHA